MNIENRIRNNPDFLYIKQEKRYKGMDVYLVVSKEEHEDRKNGIAPKEDFGGGPIFVLVDSNGESRKAADWMETGDIGRAIGIIR